MLKLPTECVSMPPSPSTNAVEAGKSGDQGRSLLHNKFKDRLGSMRLYVQIIIITTAATFLTFKSIIRIQKPMNGTNLMI